MSDISEDVDILDATDTMKIMGISTDDLIDNVSSSKAKDIFDFFKGAIDKKSVIQRVVKPGVDKIDYLWSYIQSRKEHMRLSEEIGGIKERYDDLSKRLKIKEQELRIFEK